MLYLYNLKIQKDKTICPKGLDLNYGFSSYVIAFTIGYICYPMFHYNAINIWMLTGLLLYLGFDVVLHRYVGSIPEKLCFTWQLFGINTIYGIIISVIITSLMISGGSSKYLFFNEMSSDTKVMTVPKNQSFKCSVYKNGELVSSTTA
jgi:hypothetical protein